MKISVKTIPHCEQRYETVGDWWFVETEDLEIRVSYLGDWRFEALIAHHEITEALLCYNKDISDAAVTKFDDDYEVAKPLSKNSSESVAPCGCSITRDSEPGDDPHAPYYIEHQIATGFERILAAQFDVPWHTYEEAIADD